MNKVVLIGRASRDVETNEMKNGDLKATITLALNGYGDKVEYFTIIAWKKTAELAAKYIDKGDRICVVGRLQANTYDTEKGEKRTIYNVVADEIEFLTTKKEKEEERKEKVAELKEKLNNEDDDDLPF